MINLYYCIALCMISMIGGGVAESIRLKKKSVGELKVIMKNNEVDNMYMALYSNLDTITNSSIISLNVKLLDDTRE